MQCKNCQFIEFENYNLPSLVLEALVVVVVVGALVTVVVAAVVEVIVVVEIAVQDSELIPI